MSERGRGVAVMMGLLVLVAVAQGAFAAASEQDMVARGRYLSSVAGCNDCHTPGFLMTEGKVPEELWLTGSNFGWRGPWGTTYATNLRLFMANLTEEEWLTTAKNLKARPPMPWFTLNDMHDEDLRAIYHYVRHLGAGGKEAPAYVPPDQVPPQPYALFPSPPPENKGQK